MHDDIVRADMTMAIMWLSGAECDNADMGMMLSAIPQSEDAITASNNEAIW